MTSTQTEELTWTETVAVGRIGRTGQETHLIRCEVAMKDADKPWAREMVRKAHTFCSSGRIGYRTPHSLRFNLPLNTQTVTCEHCRGFRCVEEAR